MTQSSKNSKLLTEEQILQQPDSCYMNQEQLTFFHHRLIEYRKETMDRIEQVKKDMSKPIDLSDVNDRATSEEQSNIALRIRDRENKLVMKIDKSLKRIRDGEYGYCEESGEPIGIPRLLARPTAEYSAEIKSLRELKEHNYSD
ncbi:MAG: RNA polymerase-binding protein DksA [Acidiferrobacterales bacterium]|nr:RNA polymerase-binding protein DksA [Acidiferrobacterales bacterium]